MRTILFILAAPLFATTSAWITPKEVSPQQVIIRIRTDQALSSCTVTAVEALTGDVPDDVNTTLFPGSTACGRTGSVVRGSDVGFVLGLRYSPAISSVGADGNIESRSLFANTAYTVTVTAGSDAPVVLNFSTTNIPLGKTYTSSSPFCVAGFGNWCWPTISWTSQTKRYADPESGIKIKRATKPGAWGQEAPLADFDFAVGGSGWTNPQNVLNGAGCLTGGSSNCAQTSNGNSIFVAAKGINSGDCVSGYSGGSTGGSCDDQLIAIFGKAAVSGAETVTVGRSYYDSGATTPGGTQNITLSDSAYTNIGFPSPNPGWSCNEPCSGGTPNWVPQMQGAEWGGTLPKQGDWGNAYGRAASTSGVTTSSTSVIGNCYAVATSQACFNPKWNNSYLHIVGSGCTNGGTDVCQINGHPIDGEHLTLKNAPATACTAQCDWDSYASGFVITPNGGGQIDIGAQYSYAYSAMYQLPIEGYPSPCNPVPVSVDYEADGTTPISPPILGELCVFSEQGAQTPKPLWLYIPSRGEMRELSPAWTPPGVDYLDAAGDQNAAQLVINNSPWDGISPNCFFGYGATQSGPNALFRGCYSGNWVEYTSIHPAYGCAGCAGNSGTIFPGQDPGVFWYCTTSCNSQRWADDPITYTDLTPPSMGLDPLSQAAANNPNYSTWGHTIWPSFLLDQMVNGEAIFAGVTAQQGLPNTFISISTVTGQFGFYGDTFFNQPFTWGSAHSQNPSRVGPGYYGTVLNYANFGNPSWNLGGPFISIPTYVYNSGVPSSNTAISNTAPLEPCSNYSITNSQVLLWITQNGGQNQCMHIRMMNVASHTPSAPELAKWPSPQNASWSEPKVLQSGDEIALPNEQDLVAAVTQVTDTLCPSGCLDVVVSRGIPTSFANGRPPANEPNGWSAIAGPTLGPCCSPGIGAWVPANTKGEMSTGAYFDPEAFGAHSSAGPGLKAGNMTYLLAGFPTYDVRFNQAAPGLFGSFIGANSIVARPPFYGKFGSITTQSYPSNQQWAAWSTRELTWFSDLHHTSPSDGLGPEQPITIDPLTYSLIGGTSTLYSVSVTAGGLANTEANYKAMGLQGWDGYNLIQDVSGPSSSLSDSAEHQACLALAVGECHGGSSVGSVFATAPYVRPSAPPNCFTNWYAENYPCLAMSLPSVAGEVVQHDASFNYGLFEGGRILSKCLSGYGRQYEFGTAIPDPTGTGVFCKADWADGVRSEIFVLQVPPFPSGDSTARSSFVSLPVNLPGGYAYAEARFGNAENGSPTSYYCTARADVCTTSGAPFMFASIDSRAGHLLGCSSGCEINIPAVPGLVVYYTTCTSPDGSTWTCDAEPNVALAPGA